MMERDIYVMPERGIPRADGGARHAGATARAKEEAATLGELFRSLGNDASTLVREEVRLAKLELRQEARAITADLVKVAIALGLALLGAQALTAFLILVVGNLLGDAFWAGALIVGAVFLLIGGLLARGAMRDMKSRSFAEDTRQTLQEDQRWAKEEVQHFKREMRA